MVALRQAIAPTLLNPKHNLHKTIYNILVIFVSLDSHPQTQIQIQTLNPGTCYAFTRNTCRHRTKDRIKHNLTYCQGMWPSEKQEYSQDSWNSSILNEVLDFSIEEVIELQRFGVEDSPEAWRAPITSKKLLPCLLPSFLSLFLPELPMEKVPTAPARLGMPPKKKKKTLLPAQNFNET